MHASNVVVAWANAVQASVGEARSGLGIDSRELTALTLTSEHAWCTAEWLRQRVGLTQSGMTRLIDRLTARGLLERVTVAGRTVPLRLTTEGMRVLEAWAEARDRAVDDLLTGLAAGQRDQLVATIRAALEEEPRDRRTADATCGSCTWPSCGTDCPVDLSVVDETG